MDEGHDGYRPFLSAVFWINVQRAFQAVLCCAAPRCAVGVSLDLIIGWSCRYVAGQVESCWKMRRSAAFTVAKAKVLLRQASSRAVALGGFQPRFLL